jgi:hypothetical protein
MPLPLIALLILQVGSQIFALTNLDLTLTYTSCVAGITGIPHLAYCFR